MLDKQYDSTRIEPEIYDRWERSGFFNPDKLPPKQQGKPFTIIMPPPNANGALHLGHAVMVTLEDILVRFFRMRGRKALWLPGADHAGFETQVVFEKKLEKEGKSRFSMERDELWRAMFDFTQTNKVTMERQLRKLGASCDWSRETFTLDEKVITEVHRTFVQLYEDNLIYRDLRIVNWCPKHQTALSDLEVKYIEREDPLYFVKYGPLTLATVRPETKFGDTGLAVNPKDKRYQRYIGKEIEAQGVLGPVRFTVIADEAVDPKFGTGVVKVTPAHDQTDFEMWQRHKNEIAGPVAIIDERGRLAGKRVGEFAGLKVAEARMKVAERMREIGILEKVDERYVHQVATCYKCGSTLEPLPKEQWFVRMEPLAKRAADAVRKKQIAFHPERSKKVYFHWLKNIRDWNISRQIVWGIRIPAWFCAEMNNEACKEKKGVIVAEEKPKRCPWCSSAKLEQDPDVFDTWFSSGQWPFLTLNYPDGEDYKEFYPTDVMETGYDILFFWVARMIMLGLYRTGTIPFKHVYLHGLVRDKDKQKMSKSKGNVVDPLGVAELYGTDALRVALVAGNTAGNDAVISEEKIRGYRNFATKIWNASRFVLMSRKPEYADVQAKQTSEDKKRLAELKRVKAAVAKHLERFEFHLAVEKSYHYFWHTFADKIIEGAKPRLRDGSLEEQAGAYELLETVLRETLSMLHPFMPFITEAIYQEMPKRDAELLMIAPW